MTPKVFYTPSVRNNFSVNRLYGMMRAGKMGMMEIDKIVLIINEVYRGK